MRIGKLIRLAGLFAALALPTTLTGCDDDDGGTKGDGAAGAGGSTLDGSVKQDGAAGAGGGGASGGTDGGAGAGGNKADGGPDGSTAGSGGTTGADASADATVG